MRSFWRLVAIVLCFISLCALATTIPNPTKRKGAGPLFQINRGKKWGYMDRTGRIQIPPRFDYERDFFGGLAGVLIGERWGYINERGALVVQPQFDDVRDFLDDLAPVRIGRTWGYIDKSGRIAIKPQFQAAAEFHEGLARVYLWERVLCGSGSYTNNNAPDYAFILEEDDKTDLRVCFPEGGRFGFVNKAGAFAIRAAFFIAQDFSQGLAAVRVEETETSKYGYIDQTGSFVVSPRFNQAAPFSEGLARVETSARREGNRMVNIAWGFVDKSGHLAIPAIDHMAGNFSEGVASVEVQPGKHGYIDHEGHFAIPPRFEITRDFSDGLAEACDESGCHYINHSGGEAVKGMRAWWPFSDGLSVTPFYGDRQNYIDKTGRIIAGYNYQRN